MPGFTFIELLISMAIVAVIMSFAAVSLNNLVPKAQLATSLSQMVVDIQNQQYHVMTGEVDETVGLTKGVQFAENSYTLFNGDTFQANHPSNYTVELPPTVKIRNVTLPNNTIIFSPLSGDCQNCPNGEEVGFEVGDENSSARAIMVVNEFGVLEIARYQ